MADHLGGIVVPKHNGLLFACIVDYIIDRVTIGVDALRETLGNPADRRENGPVNASQD